MSAAGERHAKRVDQGIAGTADRHSGHGFIPEVGREFCEPLSDHALLRPVRLVAGLVARIKSETDGDLSRSRARPKRSRARPSPRARTEQASNLQGRLSAEGGQYGDPGTRTIRTSQGATPAFTVPD